MKHSFFQDFSRNFFPNMVNKKIKLRKKGSKKTKEPNSDTSTNVLIVDETATDVNIIDAASDINFIDSENVMTISLNPSDFILKEEQIDSDRNQVTSPPLVIDELEPEKEKNSVIDQNETRSILNNPEDFSASLQESNIANTVTLNIKRKSSDKVKDQSKSQRLYQVPVITGQTETGAWINYRGNDSQQSTSFFI